MLAMFFSTSLCLFLSLHAFYQKMRSLELKPLKLPAAPLGLDLRFASTIYGECDRFCGSRLLG